MKGVLKIKHVKGEQIVFPKNHLVRNWMFDENEHAEAALAHYIGEVGEKNGLSATDLMHLFPYILRMLKSNIAWSK